MAAIAALAFALATHAQRQAGSAFLNGHFELRDALTFHVVNDNGEDFTARIRWRDAQQTHMDRPLMVRVFDPEERLLERRYEPGERVEGEAPWHVMDVPVPAKGAGVYQIAVNGFAGAELQFDVDPALRWGVYASPTLVIPVEQTARGWFIAPGNAQALNIQTAGSLRQLSIADRAGVRHLTLGEAQASGVMRVGSGADRLCAVEIEAQGRCEIDFGQHAVILCAEESTAAEIGASATTLDDGMICHHKFQSRAQALLEQYRSLPASAFEVPVPALSRYRQAWLLEPERNALLLGPYGAFAALQVLLHEQDLDPASPTFGQIHTWREGVAESARLLPAAATLAAVYSVDAPFNPLYRNEALRNRIIIAALQDLMLLRESELPHPLVSLYAGGERAFAFARLTRGFPLVIRDCTAEVREVWTEGVQRYADRMSITQVASTVNQWSYIIRGLQQVAEGVDDPHYARMVDEHIRWLLTNNQFGRGRGPAGYFEENEGPDATYSGIALHNLAWVWERTRHEGLWRALDECLTLFNHTIAPEPDGSALGTSSFSHRTSGTWLEVQSGGGVAMLADDSAAAAALLGHVWLSPSRARTTGQRRVRQRELLQRLEYLPLNALSDPAIGLACIAGAAELHFALWEHYASQPQPGELPVISDERFTRNFGEEFFCVRRPGYYAFMYAGTPMGKWQEPRRPADPRQLHPRNGGGLCMFWSPQFGSSINARNVSALAAHSLLARHTSGADWEEYWSIDRNFDANAATASVTGRIRNQPLRFQRRYAFQEDRIDCELTVTAEQALELQQLIETFPYPLEKPGGIRIMMLDARGRPIRSGQASAIAFQSRTASEVHLIVFGDPRECAVRREHGHDERGARREHGSIVTSLPSHWRADQVVTLRWSMLATPRKDIESQVAAIVDQLQ